MIRRILLSTARDRSGATMVEYGLIAALVAIAAVAGMGTIGG
ncbi:MAG: Flp family type IVb pilin, partial [Xanthobacteraceae bacterium]